MLIFEYIAKQLGTYFSNFRRVDESATSLEDHVQIVSRYFKENGPNGRSGKPWVYTNFDPEVPLLSKKLLSEEMLYTVCYFISLYCLENNVSFVILV